MTTSCPKCEATIDGPSTFCVNCGAELPVEAAFTELALKLKTGQELRIEESSLFECEVLNRSSLPVANVEVSLSCSRFVGESGCFVDHLEPNSSGILDIEVDVARAGKAILYIDVKGLIDGRIPICYKGQTRINPTRKEVMKTESDPRKVVVNIGQDAMVDLSGGIRIDSGHRGVETSSSRKLEWIEISLKRDPMAERAWFDHIKAKSLQECPYCSGLIDTEKTHCEICAALLPSWLTKRRDVLIEFRGDLPPLSRAELKIPSLDGKTFRFYTGSRITWGRHSDNDLHLLLYTDDGELEKEKSLAISKFAGKIEVEDGRAILTNENKFDTQFITQHTLESIQLRKDERVEIRQGGMMNLSDLCALDLELYTSPRKRIGAPASTDIREGQRRSCMRMMARTSEKERRLRSSCYDWPDKNIESVKISRADIAPSTEYVLLENSATIGSGEGCCVNIPASGLQQNYARIIYYADSLWFENLSNTPISFETGTKTKQLSGDAIMKVDTDCTIKLGQLETRLKLVRKKSRIDKI